MKTNKQIPAKKPKFVRIEEITKSKYGKDVFYGVVRSECNERIVASVVKSDSGDPWIQVEEFDKAGFKITSAEREDVKHFFKAALLKSEKNADSAEFDLRNSKRQFATATERFNSVFL